MTEGSTRTAGCASDLDLDELLAGDLAAGPTLARVRSHLDGCARCRARFASFAAVVPPPVPALPPEVSPPLEMARPRRRFFATAAFGAAAAAIAIVALRSGTRPAASDGERSKGTVGLTVIVKRAATGAVETVAGEGRLAAGDEMRFTVVASKPGFAVVIGLDAAPSVTIYVPAPPALRPVRVEGTGPITLPGSIVADQTAGLERIVAMVCDAEIAPAALKDRAMSALAQAQGQLDRVSSPIAGCHEASVLMRKEPRSP